MKTGRAIVTRYLGPTDHRGSRVVASTNGKGKRVTVPWNCGLDVDDNHDAAARALIQRLGWDERLEWDDDLVRANAPDQRGKIYILTWRTP